MTVEVALTLPVFLLLVFGMIEFSHAMFVKAALTNAAKEGARMGSVEGATTASVRTFIENRINAVFPASQATILIKNASIYDTSSSSSTTVTTSSLPDIELSTAETRQLFIVEVTVPYKNVAVTKPFWVKSITLLGQSVMRHE